MAKSKDDRRLPSLESGVLNKNGAGSETPLPPLWDLIVDVLLSSHPAEH
ncbi:MAG: hypothetical protein AB1497_08640 [Bacillota bacterium]